MHDTGDRAIWPRTRSKWAWRKSLIIPTNGILKRFRRWFASDVTRVHHLKTTGRHASHRHAREDKFKDQSGASPEHEYTDSTRQFPAFEFIPSLEMSEGSSHGHNNCYLTKLKTRGWNRLPFSSREDRSRGLVEPGKDSTRDLENTTKLDNVPTPFWLPLNPQPSVYPDRQSPDASSEQSSTQLSKDCLPDQDETPTFKSTERDSLEGNDADCSSEYSSSASRSLYPPSDASFKGPAPDSPRPSISRSQADSTMDYRAQFRILLDQFCNDIGVPTSKIYRTQVEELSNITLDNNERLLSSSLAPLPLHKEGEYGEVETQPASTSSLAYAPEHQTNHDVSIPVQGTECQLDTHQAADADSGDRTGRWHLPSNDLSLYSSNEVVWDHTRHTSSSITSSAQAKYTRISIDDAEAASIDDCQPVSPFDLKGPATQDLDLDREANDHKANSVDSETSCYQPSHGLQNLGTLPQASLTERGDHNSVMYPRRVDSLQALHIEDNPLLSLAPVREEDVDTAPDTYTEFDAREMCNAECWPRFMSPKTPVPRGQESFYTPAQLLGKDQSQRSGPIHNTLYPKNQRQTLSTTATPSPQPIPVQARAPRPFNRIRSFCSELYRRYSSSGPAHSIMGHLKAPTKARSRCNLRSATDGELGVSVLNELGKLFRGLKPRGKHAGDGRLASV